MFLVRLDVSRCQLGFFHGLGVSAMVQATASPEVSTSPSSSPNPRVFLSLGGLLQVEQRQTNRAKRRAHSCSLSISQALSFEGPHSRLQEVALKRSQGSHNWLSGCVKWRGGFWPKRYEMSSIFNSLVADCLPTNFILSAAVQTTHNGLEHIKCPVRATASHAGTSTLCLSHSISAPSLTDLPLCILV